MPYADPGASFDGAVRHLFRYLNNAQRLKCNPLVRRLFDAPDAPASSVRARDNATITLVRRLVREGAERCWLADEASGRREHARCKRAIALSNLLGDESVEAVARSLGVSVPHCYRLRTDLCRRVAQNVQRYNDAPASTVLPVLDEFRARISAAMLRGQVGDFRGAEDEYERLAQAAGSIPRKIEALALRSMVLTDDNQVERAAEAISSAEALSCEHAGYFSDTAANLARAHIEFARWRLAVQRCDGPAALDAIESTNSHLDAIRAAVPDYVGELRAEVLVKMSWTLRNFGDSPAAEEQALHDAAGFIARVRSPRATLALEVDLVLERTRNTRLIDAVHWRPASRRFEALTDLCERARALGSLNHNLSAAFGFVEYGAQMGNGELMWQAARYVLSLTMRHPNPQFVAQTVVHLAEIITYTDHWHYAERLLREIDRELLAITHGGVRECVEALCYLRSGSYAQAWKLATSPARENDTPLCTAKMRTIAAGAADGLGRQREAIDIIERAIPKLELVRTALPLRYSYTIAAEITGDPHFLRKAEEVTYLLTS
jgi:hypothetical protein